MPEVAPRPLLHRAMQRAADHLIPIQVSLELTYRCNLACKHCYRDAGERDKDELNTEQSLIEQRREQVMQETEKLKAEINADQENQVAQTRAMTTRNVAEIEKETSAVCAAKTRKLGEAEAKVITMVEGEKALGQSLKVKAFEDPAAYSLWEFANSLNDKLLINILHSGTGTLWTDMEKARLGDLGGAAVLQKQTPEKQQ